jgi:hypothetical protein
MGNFSLLSSLISERATITTITLTATVLLYNLNLSLMDKIVDGNF